MGGYDAPRYRVNQILGPVLCSFASALLKVTASPTIKSGTSANVNDRIKFFRNVKITGLNAITRSVGIVGGSKLISAHNLRVCLYNTTGLIASCKLGTVAGMSTTGAISATSALAHADAGEQMQVKIKATGDGTAGTFDEVSCDLFIEYQERF
jgi:hypothetical protein